MDDGGMPTYAGMVQGAKISWKANNQKIGRVHTDAPVSFAFLLLIAWHYRAHLHPYWQVPALTLFLHF